MNLCLSMVLLRPSSFVIPLAYAALIVLFSLPPCWYVKFTRLEQHVNLNSEKVLSQFQSEIENLTRLIKPMNSSSTNLARCMSSTLKATNISFSDIETKVAPLLFQAFQTVPHIAQISYIGMEGFVFSFYTDDDDQALAMYSNTSSSLTSTWGSSNTTQYFIQPVNRDTGQLYGDATTCKPSINASWVGEAVNSSNGYVSLGTKWNNGHDILFISSARITTTGVISIGFPATAITDFFTTIGQQGAILYLATKDGQVLAEGIQHTRVVVSNDTVSFQSMNNSANGDQTTYEGAVSCKDGVVASILKIEDVAYLIHCSFIDIMGIESVYALAVPQNGLVSFVNNCKKYELMLLSAMMVMTFIATISFLFTNVQNARAAGREMHLRESLNKQKEATDQAERKSMNKSLALDTASHDIRASLAGLTGLIELSFKEVVAGSELETNLKQMDSCTKDLIGLLNSILDTSKIEAGKMALEEEEFDVFQLVEDVVDLYHPVGMKKGVDIVLDPCNGSILRYSRTKGDRGKLKQVLCNLLSNAVKFTDEGHIAVRAWAQKPTLQNSMIATNRSYNFTRPCWACLFNRKNEPRHDIEAVNSTQQDHNRMCFIFEVDDTGKGIPKDKYKSVFENYVQLKETVLGVGGSGLGLGIVQSLVRLMHGDIGIVDKDIGENGTCFRFNVLLAVCETGTDDITREGESGPGDRNQSQGLTIRTTSSGSSMCSLSPRLPICSPSPRPMAPRVVLLIQDEERRRTTQRFMESLGIKVKVVKQWTHLSHTLSKIKKRGHHSNSLSSPGSSGFSSRSASHNSSAKSKGVHLSAVDGTDYVNSIFKKTDNEATPGFVLIVIDAKAGPFPKLCRVVSNFKRGFCSPCRVVWLDNLLMRSVDFESLDEDAYDSNDIVLRKPFHGSRLFQVIRLLPEYGGGTWQCSSSSAKREGGSEVSPRDQRAISSVELQKYGSSRSRGWKEPQQSFGDQSCDRSKARTSPVHQGGTQKCGESSNDNKPLSGKKILVVEDVEMLRRIALVTLERLGASVEKCENGEQAVQLVEEGLTRDFPNPPYDYILMDCQMPVMNGSEATRRIREIEKPYDVRIPIIALTANTGEEAKTTLEAGMDDYLVKPIKKELLLEAIRNVHSRE